MMVDSVWVLIVLPTEMSADKPESMQLNQGSFLNKQDESLKGNYFEFPNTLKSALEKTFEELEITNAVWIRTNDDYYYHVYFMCDVDDSDNIIQYIHDQGIGSIPKTFIGIIPFSLAYQASDEYEVFSDDQTSGDESKKAALKKQSSFKAMQEKFLKSVTARLTVAQVVANVQAGAELTFDFLCYVICASWLAACGLLDSDVVTLVASMLVSPLMGAIMAMTFGFIVQDRALRNLGIRNASIGFILAILFGIVYGLIVLNFAEEYNPNTMWPTSFMQARGLRRTLWTGALAALPSGAAVALSILSGNQSSLVGVAISASLLPPCVNTGLLWALALIRSMRSLGENYVRLGNESHAIFIKPSLMIEKGYHYAYSENIAYECFFLGLSSFGLATVNVACILLMSWLLLKIKEVTPTNKISSPTSRFWQEDIKIARDYNKTSHGERKRSLQQDLLEEWANLAGIDPSELLSESPDAQYAQLQTLKDLIKDVEEDQVFQQIYANTRPEADIVRKMSLVPSGAKEDHKSSENLAMSDIESGRSRLKSITFPVGFNHMARRSIVSRPDITRRPRSPLSPTDGQRRKTSISTASFVSQLPESEFLQRRRQSSAFARKSLRNIDHHHGGWPRRGSELRFAHDSMRRAHRNEPLDETSEQQ